MSDVYPRFTIAARPRGDRLAYRVSQETYAKLSDDALLDRGPQINVSRYNVPPRFRIKIDPATTSGQPFVLADASRPIYRGRFSTLADALAGMDDKVREERGRERYSSRHVNTPCTVEPIISEPSA